MRLMFPGFPLEILSFLRKLKRPNDRAWFLAHKSVYDAKVREPTAENAVGGMKWQQCGSKTP